jgi:hypothetical protein
MYSVQQRYYETNELPDTYTYEKFPAQVPEMVHESD